MLVRHEIACTIDVGAGRTNARHRPGAVAVLPPNAPTLFLADGLHELRVTAIPYARLMTLAGEGAGLPPDGDFGVAHAGVFHDAEVRRIITRLWRETEAGNPAGMLGADALILQMAAALLRIAVSGTRCASEAIGGTLRHHGMEDRIHRVQDYIRAQLHCDLTVPELAGVAALSPWHFIRVFTALAGLSPHQFVIGERMRLAQHLLTATRLPVAEIARQVGYADVSRFGQHFRRRIGATPSAWRAG